MKLPRRNFLRMTASAVALSALPGLASALDYPTRPVHVVVGFPTGTTVDIIARLVCEPLSADDVVHQLQQRGDPWRLSQSFGFNLLRSAPVGTDFWSLRELQDP